METFLFILHYVVAVLMLHTILFGSYEYDLIYDNNRYYPRTIHEKTDRRHKYPLWAILLSVMILFVPIANIFAYGLWILYVLCGPEDCNIYFKSFLTKRI